MTQEREHKYKKLSSLIDQFLDTLPAEAEFESEKVWRYLGIDYDDREAKHYISDILCYKVRKEELHGRKGRYRKVDKTANVIDWQHADSSKVVDLKFPFGLEKYVEIYPRNIIIYAGEKDAGKTAILLNIVRLNMDTQDIVYFTSELGELELRKRLYKFEKEGLIALDMWNFIALERDSNFADVIEPDKINIIDYLEVHTEFYEVAGYINDIYRRLRNGVAIIALQKNPNSHLGLGGERSREKARLYLTLKPGELTIETGKNWKNEKINPKGKKFKFKLIQGCRFIEEG